MSSVSGVPFAKQSYQYKLRTSFVFPIYCLEDNYSFAISATFGKFDGDTEALG